MGVLKCRPRRFEGGHERTVPAASPSIRAISLRRAVLVSGAGHADGDERRDGDTGHPELKQRLHRGGTSTAGTCAEESGVEPLVFSIGDAAES
jgi:hypothetical protein